MRVLSIDVGMKNLAYCLFEYDLANASANSPTKTPESMMHQLSIVAWDTVNLCDAADTNAHVVAAPACSSAGCKFTADRKSVV